MAAGEMQRRCSCGIFAVDLSALDATEELLDTVQVALTQQTRNCAMIFVVNVKQETQHDPQKMLLASCVPILFGHLYPSLISVDKTHTAHDTQL